MSSLNPFGEILIYARGNGRLAASSGEVTLDWPYPENSWRLSAKEQSFAWREPELIATRLALNPSQQLFAKSIALPALPWPGLAEEARAALDRYSSWQLAVATVMLLSAMRQATVPGVDYQTLLPVRFSTTTARPAIETTVPRLMKLPALGELQASLEPVGERMWSELEMMETTAIPSLKPIRFGGRVAAYPVFMPTIQQVEQASSLAPTLALFERFRPDTAWLNYPVTDQLSPIYATGESAGFKGTRIPVEMAPVYAHIEQVFGISRYLLMAIASIESKQGRSMVSPTNCQGWGQFCPGTVRLFAGKQLLPADFDPYDEYDGIAGIAVHLWVSSLGVGSYKQLVASADADGRVPWPQFWEGEVPAFAEFERLNKAYPFIPALWGYNRSSSYGYSVVNLAKSYRDADL